jgi:ABC-2 type transport system permease protein
MKTFAKLYVATVKEYARDRMSVFWTMAFPILFIFMFGLIFSGGGSNFSLDIGLVLQDSDPTAQGVVTGFRNVPVFNLSESDDLDAELDALRRGDRDMVVVLPENLSQALENNRTSAVEVYYDPSQTTVAQAGLSVLRETFNIAERFITQRQPLFSLQPREIQAEPLRNVDYLVPGILAMSLMQLGLFGTAAPLVSLREQGVLRRLGATPLPRSTMLASQVAFRLTLGFVQTFLLVGIGNLVFQVSIGDNIILLALVSLLGALLFVALGFVIAGVAKSEESAVGISQVINFPMMFLSGIFFPISFVPAFLSPIIALIPLTYLGDALRQIMTGSPPSNPLGVDLGVSLLILFGWLVVMVVLAVRTFRWE